MRAASVVRQPGGRRARAGAALALGALLCASGAAHAQAFVDLYQVNGLNALSGDQGFNRETCAGAEELRLALRLRGLTEPAYQLRMVQYDVGGPLAPCPSDMLEPVRVEVVPSFSLVPTGTEFILDRTFTPVELLGADACGEPGARANVNLCLQLTVLPGDRQAVLVAGIVMDYDTILPPAVDLDELVVTPGPSSLTFETTPPDGDVEAYDLIAEYRLCPASDSEDDADAGVTTDDGQGEPADPESLCGAAGELSQAVSEEAGTVRIDGLPSGQDIEARFFLVDAFGNVGPVSALGLYRTALGVGPLELYDGAGSQMSCAASCEDLGSAAAGLGGVLLLLSRRSRRAWRGLSRAAARVGGSAAAVLVVWGAASPAAAFPGQTTVGIAGASYTPAIDDERVGGRPIFPIYECFFSGDGVIELGGDFDVHLFDEFGSLQASLGLSAAQAKGKAQPSSGTTCQEPTDVDVQLTMLKARPGLTYRFDPLLDWVGFPLVPYGRLGLVLQGYAFTMGGDFNQGAVDPVGLRTGWEAAVGAMLALDLLDSLDPFVPDTTRRARANGVFDHTFLYVEGAHQVVDSFGEAGFIFSPKDGLMNTGLPILWRIGVAVELL